jgi:predicted nucleic acid-binding Zn ribbon protein
MMCPNRVAAIQSISDEPLEFCPDCGLGVKRVVSKVSINLRAAGSASQAAKRGFTTWKKAGKDTWEKVDGPGADVIVGDPSDVDRVRESKNPKRVVDLDKSP